MPPCLSQYLRRCIVRLKIGSVKLLPIIISASIAGLWSSSPVEASDEDYSRTGLYPGELFEKLDPWTSFTKESLLNQRDLSGSFTIRTVLSFCEDSEEHELCVLSRPVGRLSIQFEDRSGNKQTTYCTASIVSDDYILTNHHCVPGDRSMRGMGFKVVQANLVMDYLEENDKNHKVYKVDVVPVETDDTEALDYAILRIHGNPAQHHGRISLAGVRNPGNFENLLVIQHPLALPKRIARNCGPARAVKFIVGDTLRHRCDTEQASSGSPVFSERERVLVGLHFRGSPDSLKGEQAYNSAVLATSILAHSKILRGLADKERVSSPTVPDDSPRNDPDLEQLKLLASQGNADAQFNLGWMYADGRGVAKDDAQAVHWFRLAADQRYAPAQNSLGWWLMEGRGVARDYDKAVHLFRLAVDQGNANAQDSLGWMYQNGWGVAQDHATAVHWYRLAAAQGNATAQYNLGMQYREGRGVKKSHADAAHWFHLAATNGHADAQVNLGWLFRDGMGVSKDLNAAVHWFRQAARQGSNNGWYNLAHMYERGWGVPLDFVRAHAFYTLSGNADRLPTLSSKMAQKQVNDAKNLAHRCGVDPAGYDCE